MQALQFIFTYMAKIHFFKLSFQCGISNPKSFLIFALFNIAGNYVQHKTTYNGFFITAAVLSSLLYIILKYILSGVVGQVQTITMLISALDNRIKTMNHDMVKLVILISSALNLRPDLDRISRADGKEDARKD